MPKAVLFTFPLKSGPILERYRGALERRGLQIEAAKGDERLGEKELLRFAGRFDGVVCGDDDWNRRVLEAFSPRLKVLSKWGTGIDSIDQEAAAELGIQVRNIPSAFTVPVAETTIGCMLVFARRINEMDRDLKAGGWSKVPAVQLQELTLGVIGVGDIGKAVIRRARPFGTRVLGNDIRPIDPSFLQETGTEMVSLEDLLSESDIVSVHCDLNPTSRRLINGRTLGLMKPEAVLINMARGPIVEESQLILALQEKRIAGAALDVFEEEPLAPESPLRRMENVLLSPHNSNSGRAAWDNANRMVVWNLLDGMGEDTTGI